MKEIVLGLGAFVLAGVGVQSQKKAVTYTETIRPIISAKCLPCHSKSANVGPFDFSTYESVTSRIELIRTQALSRSMPPMWAHSEFGKFSKIEQLSDVEAVHLQDWIQQKMPKGVPNGIRQIIPVEAPVPLTTSFTLAKNQKVRAEGIPYWNVASINLPTKGGQFDSFDLVPANPRVIRYATVAIVPKDMKLPAETIGSMDLPAKYLVGVWAPGYSRWNLPAGMSLSYGPNSKLVVQTHYRPTGKQENAAFLISFSTPKQSKSRTTSWISMEDKGVFIPSGKSRVVELTRPLDQDVTIISILPEARFYAGQIQLFYTSKDGKEQTILDAVRWDPYWGGNYMFPKPVVLAKGGTLTARFHYNNDKYCRINEGKKLKDIHAGPTASDEVCRMHLLVGP